MKGNQNGCYPLQDVINFMSTNIGKGGTTHDIALARASELRIDVLIVQEPWWYNSTKSHPHYELYLPFGGENIRPRAATYVRKDPNRITSYLPKISTLSNWRLLLGRSKWHYVPECVQSST